MKYIYTLAISLNICLFFPGISFAQSDLSSNLFLKSGTEEIPQQSTDDQYVIITKNINNYVILMFNAIPDEGQKEVLSATGIRLYNYLPDKAFYASFSNDLSKNDLQKLNLHAVLEITATRKTHPMIKTEFPTWSYDANGNVTLILSYFRERSDDFLINQISAYGAELIENEKDVRRAFVSISERRAKKLLDLNFVYFMEPVDAPSKPENYTGRTQHRSNMLAEEFNGGLKYDGTGIQIGMHDDGIIGPHIDYEGRLPIQFPTGNSGDHGDHVAGTIMGAGNLDPKGRGMAFGADLYVYSSSNNNYDSVTSHYNKYNVIITSKSYSNGCNAGYTSLTQKLDQQTRQLSSLLHVFSAGNDGTSDCSYGAGPNWGNITGGHKMGKNVIATGNLTEADVLAGSSSRGPADDGRIKPDICAKGSSVYSTIDENDYGTKSGTSMACPGISGSLAQLYHAYKSLNSNQNPKSGLMKGVILNTADDLGNPGPDFKFGWGRINLRKALEVIENNQYFTSTMTSIGTKMHNISVPANVKQLRIMTYWHDFEASTSVSKALVNDIDMVVTTPSSATILPWVLDPTPTVTALNSNATHGVDHLNNMEQVTIDNPASGNYTVTLSPFAIPQGPQEYFVIYEFIYDEVVLTYPNGGEGFVPGESEIIRWDASEGNSTFKLEYSVNGGSSWNIINSLVAAGNRQTTWVVPNNVSSNVLVKLTRGSQVDVSDEKFTIVGVPQNLQINWVCPDSLKFSWSNVGSSTGYDVYLLGNKYMDSVSTTSLTTYTFHGLNTTIPHWISASSYAGTGPGGRRAIAIKTPVGNVNCPIKDDAAVATIVSPGDGSQFSCNPIEASVYVKNDGANPVMNLPIKCTVDGSIALLGTVFDTIVPGDSVLYTFLTAITPTSGTHTFKCFVDYPNDMNALNDTGQHVIMHYITGSTVSTPFSEDFESFANCATNSNCGTTICNLTNSWVNDPNGTIDDHDWRVDNGGTPSDGTGPSIDHKPGTASGKYLYTEASEDCYFKISNVITPCLDLSQMVKPRMAYWYHMFGQDMGDLYVDVLHKGRWFNEVKIPQSGDQGDLWQRDSVVLTSFAGEIINIRFRGITGDYYRSDMAIDDISVYETFIPPDAIEEFKHNIHVRLYPNPANDLINISWENHTSGLLQLMVTDLSGKAIISKQLAAEGSEAGQGAVDISHVERGIYFFNLTNGEYSKVFKVVKL